MLDKDLNMNQATFQLSELVTIINQVTDFNVAMEMVLDTCVEYFKINSLGIVRYNEEEERFFFVKGHNLNAEFEKKFHFNLFTPINGYIIRKERPSKFSGIEGFLKVGNEKIELDAQIKTLYLFPFRFHEQISGFLVVTISADEKELDEAQIRLLENFVNLTAPVFHVFGPVKKRTRGFENIISKIIKDRIYEARLGLYPVSFAIFRLTLWQEMISTVALQDTVQTYQKVFDQKLSKLGDIVWLTLDTAFFIFPNADLFTAESLCNSLKEEVEASFASRKDEIQLNLKYVCISYPQSGKHTADIIGQLWIRLFDELRMESANTP